MFGRFMMVSDHDERLSVPATSSRIFCVNSCDNYMIAVIRRVRPGQDDGSLYRTSVFSFFLYAVIWFER